MRSYLNENVVSPVYNTDVAVGIRCTDQTKHFYQQNFALTSPTSGGQSVGILRGLKNHGVRFVYKTRLQKVAGQFFYITSKPQGIQIVTYYGWVVWLITWRGFGLDAGFILYGDYNYYTCYNYCEHYSTGSFSDPTVGTALHWRLASRTHWRRLTSATDWRRLTHKADGLGLTSKTNWPRLTHKADGRGLTNSALCCLL
jgi:hypothetical protein